MKMKEQSEKLSLEERKIIKDNQKQKQVKIFESFIHFYYIVSLVVICLLWYVVIQNGKVLLNDFNWSKFGWYVFISLAYLLFNILYFGNLMINEKSEKQRFLRKDVKYIINLSKVISILIIIIIISIAFKYYSNKNIVDAILTIGGGLSVLYVTLSFSMKKVILQGKKINDIFVVSILTLIIIGIIFYIKNWGFIIPIIF